MRCNKCGVDNLEDSLFCQNCGNRLYIPEHNINGGNMMNPGHMAVAKKTMNTKKIIICAVAAACILLTVVLCIVFFGKGNHDSEPLDDTGYSADNTMDEDTADFEEEAIDLSGEYDAVLASGSDEDGSYYQFVAKQEQTSSSVHTKVGVIKNDSQWLVPLTEDNPFLDNEENTISGAVFDNTNINGWSANFHYLHSGCFYGTKTYTPVHDDVWFSEESPIIIFNAETGKSIDLRSAADGICDSIALNVWNYNTLSTASIEVDSNMIVFSVFHSRDDTGYPLYYDSTKKDAHSYTTVYALNLDTLEYNRILKQDYNSTGYYKYEIKGAYYEGLFLLELFADEEDYRFYDIEGHEVFNLNSYVKQYGRITLSQQRNFYDGKFSFTVENELGNTYEITVDTLGNEISNVPVGDE